MITGKKRAGKDTTARWIAHELYKKGIKTKVLSFARPMKDIIERTFNISVDELEYAKNEGRLKAFLKFRKLVFLVVDFRVILQRFGTEGMKPVFGAEVWTNLLRSKIVDKNTVYIISDWRFPEESIETDFKIQVTNSNLPSCNDGHISENALVNQRYDMTINNSGTIGELIEQVRVLTDTY